MQNLEKELPVTDKTNSEFGEKLGNELWDYLEKEKY